jgi:isopenicillin-N epimerase
LPGGWEELRDRNRMLAGAGRALLAGRFNLPLPCPSELLASMATLILPEALQQAPMDAGRFDVVQARLHSEYRVEVPIVRWGEPKRRYVRISAQAYNSTDDYRALAEALVRLPSKAAR